MAVEGYKDVNATWTTGGNVGDYIRFYWKRTGYSSAGNYSDIEWEIRLYANANGYIEFYGSNPWSVNVNGSSYSGSANLAIGNNQNKRLAHGTTRIYHNNDGTKSFSVSFSQVFNITFNNWVGTVSGSGSWTLDTIPRYATITQKITETTQTTMTYTWSANATCDIVEYWYNGQRLNSNNINATSGTFVYTGITPGTTQECGAHIRRKDSGLWTETPGIRATMQPIATISSTDFNFNIGENLSLTFKDYDKNASTLKLWVKNKDGEWDEDISVVSIPINTSSYTWKLSNISSTLYKYTTNSSSVDIRIVFGTTIDGVFYYNYYYGTAYVKGSTPSFTNYTLSNTESSISSLLGNSSYTVQRLGNFRVQISSSQKAVAYNQASIVSYTAYLYSLDSNTIVKSVTAPYSTSQINIDLGTYHIAGNYNVCVYALDSRNLTSPTVKKTCYILPYNTPIPTISMNRLNKFEKETGLDLSVTYSNLLVGTATKNSITSISYRYAKVGNSFPSSYTSISGYSSKKISDLESTTTYSKPASSSSYFLELSINESYNFEFKITDKLSSVLIQIPVAQGVPLMGEFDNGYITVAKLPDFTNNSKFQVGTDISAKDQYGNQRNILESINNFVIVSETEPDNQIIGGIWIIPKEEEVSTS